MLLTDTPAQICPNEVVFSEAAPAGAAVSVRLPMSGLFWPLIFGAVYGIYSPFANRLNGEMSLFKASFVTKNMPSHVS